MSDRLEDPPTDGGSVVPMSAFVVMTDEMLADDTALRRLLFGPPPTWEERLRWAVAQRRLSAWIPRLFRERRDALRRRLAWAIWPYSTDDDR